MPNENMETENSLMAGSVPTFGHRESQYLTGEIESDEDGIPVVDGLSLGYGSASETEDDGISVIYGEMSSELESAWGSDEDGMSSGLGSAIQSVPKYFGVEKNYHSPPLTKKQLSRLPVIVLTSQTDESSSLSASSFSTSWSSSSGGEGDDQTSMTHRIISNIDALKLLWRGETGGKRNTKMRRSQSPTLSSTLEVVSVDPTEEADEPFTSASDSSTMSSSAAAPYASGASGDSCFRAGNNNSTCRAACARSRGSLTESSDTSSSSFSVISCTGVSSGEEADKTVESSFSDTIEDGQIVLPVFHSKTSLGLELQDSRTEKLSARSTVGASSDDTASVADGSPKKSRVPRRTVRSKQRKCRQRISFIASFLLIFTIAAIGTFMGVELWSYHGMSTPTPLGEEPSGPPLTPPAPAPNVTGYAVPMTLHLLFRRPVVDIETTAKVLGEQLTTKLSAMNGFLRMDISPVQVPHASSNFRSRRRTVVILSATVIFAIQTNTEVLSSIPNTVCELLNDVDELQEALLQEASLHHVEYEGPSGGDCGRDIFTGSTIAQPPTESPSPVSGDSPGSKDNDRGSTPVPPMPTPWTRTVPPTPTPAPRPTEAGTEYSDRPVGVPASTPEPSPVATPWHRPSPNEVPTRPPTLEQGPTQQPSAGKPSPYPRWTRPPTGTGRTPAPSKQDFGAVLSNSAFHWTKKPVAAQPTTPVKATQSAAPASTAPAKSPSSPASGPPRSAKPTAAPARMAPSRTIPVPRHAPMADLPLAPNRHPS